MTHGASTYDGVIAFDATFVSEIEATGRMPIHPGILNPFGTVHAGAMIWFADVVETTLALQGQTPTPGMSGFPLAINVTAHLPSNCKDGELWATAHYVEKGRRISTIRTQVALDQGKVLLDLTTTHVAT